MKKNESDLNKLIININRGRIIYIINKVKSILIENKWKKFYTK